MLKRSFLVFVCLVLAVSVSAGSLAAVSPSDEQVIFRHGAVGKKTVALTFDDGPHPQYTKQILALLEQYGIHATFFFIGQNIEYYRSTALSVVKAGHEVGNHTYSHPLFSKTSTEQLAKEIEMTDRLLAEIGCDDVPLFRPPQGLYGEDLPALLKNISKKAILWSIDTRDWDHRPSEAILQNIDENLRGGDIILFHDYVSGENTTIPALKKLIPALLERGYQFVTVSELLDGERTPASR